jgi:hypothetical protein
MTTYTITVEEIAAHRPDVLLPPDPEFADDYARLVEEGRRIAARKTVALVAICRNAMPWLPQTLALVEETGSMFADWVGFIYENDSTDGTKDVLRSWYDGGRRFVKIQDNGRPHLSHTIAPERTHALAEYRNACREWAVSSNTDFVIVFDTDAWGGWSVDGVATSVAHVYNGLWYGLASYSWGEHNGHAIHYDAFAARLNHWTRRDQAWFHHWHPPVGSPPLEMRSAFGQLAVYDGRVCSIGRYSGEDCEHVMFHKSIAEQWPVRRFGLNPSSRCVSFWTPRDARQHGGS